MVDLKERFRSLDEVPFTRPAPAGTRLSPAVGSERHDSDAVRNLRSRPLVTSPVRRLLTAAVALLIFAAAAAFAWSAFRGQRPQSPTSPTPVPTTTAAPTLHLKGVDRFSLGLAPHTSSDAITYGFGSIWVGTYGPSGRQLIRLDPRTGKLIDRLGLPAGPTWELGGGGLAAGDGSIWVTGSRHEDAVLLRLDPTTDRLTTLVPLGRGEGSDVVVDQGKIWVLILGTVKGSTMRIVSVDPSSNAVATTVALPQTEGHQVVAAGGSIIAGTYTHGGERGSVLEVVDPSHAGATAITLHFSAKTVLSGAGYAWAPSYHAIERIDPSDGRIQLFDSVPSSGQGGAYGLGRVWLTDTANHADVGPHPVLKGFNPSLGAVDVIAPLPAHDYPVALAIAPESVWVLNYQGTVVRVEFSS